MKPARRPTLGWSGFFKDPPVADATKQMVLRRLVTVARVFKPGDSPHKGPGKDVLVGPSEAASNVLA